MALREGSVGLSRVSCSYTFTLKLTLGRAANL